MLKWFRCEGWAEGPYPEDMISDLRRIALEKNPHAVIRVEPAWEAPFERMPTAWVNTFMGGGFTERRSQMFLFRADKLFYWFVINLRCPLKIKRADGREPFKPGSYHPASISKEDQAELDTKIREAAGGKDTWDCGWSPAIPA